MASLFLRVGRSAFTLDRAAWPTNLFFKLGRWRTEEIAAREASMERRREVVTHHACWPPPMISRTLAGAFSCRVITEMRRSFENERDYAHEKAFAAHHLNKSTQTFQGRDHDRGRPGGHLEPLLHSQRRRRGGGPGPLPNSPRRRGEAVSGPGAGASRHGSRHALDLGQRADPGTRS